MSLLNTTDAIIFRKKKKNFPKQLARKGVTIAKERVSHSTEVQETLLAFRQTYCDLASRVMFSDAVIRYAERSRGTVIYQKENSTVSVRLGRDEYSCCGLFVCVCDPVFWSTRAFYRGTM